MTGSEVGSSRDAARNASIAWYGSPRRVAAGLADRDEVRELRVALEDRQEPLPLLDGALDVARRLQDRDEAAA